MHFIFIVCGSSYGERACFECKHAFPINGIAWKSSENNETGQRLQQCIRLSIDRLIERKYLLFE